jgi:3-hydroxyisobutyrate dehydrogenase-like beta-hydroxyacid dehydrogenase
MTRVALLGLGRMGAAMAARLAAAGHEVTVWNRSPAGYARLDEELPPDTPAPRRATTPAEAARDADIVFTVLADGPALDGLLFGEAALAAALAPDAVVCDLATIGVDVARRCARRLAAAGHFFVDAPVSGSVPTVRAGNVLVMAGGCAAAFDIVAPVLTAFASKLMHVGDSGAGQAMKLSVNSIVHTLNAALAETGGVDRDLALDVISGSVVAAPFVLYKRGAFADPDAAPIAFTIDLMRKDLALIQRMATDTHTPMPVSATVGLVADRASDAGLGERDMAEIATFHRTQASH